MCMGAILESLWTTTEVTIKMWLTVFLKLWELNYKDWTFWLLLVLHAVQVSSQLWHSRRHTELSQHISFSLLKNSANHLRHTTFSSPNKFLISDELCFFFFIPTHQDRHHHCPQHHGKLSWLMQCTITYSVLTRVLNKLIYVNNQPAEAEVNGNTTQAISVVIKHHRLAGANNICW